jgi:hypothetical protein
MQKIDRNRFHWCAILLFFLVFVRSFSSAGEVSNFVIPVSSDAARAFISVQKENRLELREIFDAFGVSTVHKLTTKLVEGAGSSWRIECCMSHENASVLLQVIFRLQYDQKTWKSRDFDAIKRSIVDAVTDPAVSAHIKERRMMEKKIMEIRENSVGGE